MKISIGQNLSREHYVNLWGPESTVNGFHKKKTRILARIF